MEESRSWMSTRPKARSLDSVGVSAGVGAGEAGGGAVATVSASFSASGTVAC